MHTPQSRSSLAALRVDPAEWYRRGLTPPHVIAAYVDDRVHDRGSGGEPTYADFFAVTAA